jgi:hypothetical protein
VNISRHIGICHPENGSQSGLDDGKQGIVSDFQLFYQAGSVVVVAVILCLRIQVNNQKHLKNSCRALIKPLLEVFPVEMTKLLKSSYRRRE